MCKHMVNTNGPIFHLVLSSRQRERPRNHIQLNWSSKNNYVSLVAADQQLLKGVWWGFGDALLSNPATVIEFDILAFISLFARQTSFFSFYNYFLISPYLSFLKLSIDFRIFLQCLQLKFIRLKVNLKNISGSIAFMAWLKLYNIIMKLTRSKLSQTKRLLHSPTDKHLKICSFFSSNY